MTENAESEMIKVENKVWKVMKYFGHLRVF